MTEPPKISPADLTANGEIPAERVRTRILMVGMHLTKTRGGISTLITEILKSSLKDDFEFVYIASQSENSGRFGKLFLAMRAVAQFVFKCLKNDSAAVYVHLGSNASLYRESIFIYLAKFFGKKLVAHFHAGDIDEYFPAQTRPAQGFIRRAINSADQVIAVSAASAGQIRKIAPNAKISVIPNAIDTTVFDSPPRSAPAGREPVRVLFVGATGRLKGERDLLAAVAAIRHKKPDLKVSLLGYGAENLRAIGEELKIGEFIEFAGVVSLEERIGFFKKADIFVLPTYAEAMPMSVIEAMAAGLPVISTRVGGIPELITDGVDGLLVAPGDVPALAQKIYFLVNDPEKRAELGEKAGQKARQQMDFRSYAVNLRKHLTEL